MRKHRLEYDWFYYDLVKNVSKEKTFHACQIPQALAEMLIKASTMPNDVVLWYCLVGVGSEIEVCKALHRQYISTELNPQYYQMITDRLKNGRINPQYKLSSRKSQRKPGQTTLPTFDTTI
jgi:site-specific DNA-methyltransferase (adenine-specific)